MRAAPSGAELGLSLFQALLGLLVLALVSLGLVQLLEKALFEHDASKAPFMNLVKIVYAEKRLQELAAAIMLFQEQYGSLPGDSDSSSLPGPRGNNDGRVQKGSGENRMVFKDLHQAGKLDSEKPLFLGRKLDFHWLQGEGGAYVPGNYIAVHGLAPDIASRLDRNLDDENPETGVLLVLPAEDDGQVNVYYLVRN